MSFSNPLLFDDPLEEVSARQHITHAKEISAVSSEDEGFYDDNGTVWDLIGVAFCSLISYIFCFIYLTVLMVCALAKCIKPQKAIGNTKHKKNIKEVGSEKDYDEKDNILKFDLRYYVQLQGYDLEEYQATTEDGFHLQMHRIIVPKEPSHKARQRYPVLLLHGLLQSSAAFCTSGDHSLAFHLVETGHDVWLGNNRCGFEPSHSAHSWTNLRMWSWRLREMGTFDLPSMVNLILHTRQHVEGAAFEKLALVAHSQGTAQTFLALAKDCAPELGDKLSCFCALSPAVYTGPLVNRWFLRFIRYLPLSIYRLLFGYHGYMSIMMTMHSLLPPRLYSWFGYIMFSYMFSWDDKLWNPKYRDRQLLFSPVHISAELMYWWLGEDGFAARGCLFRHEFIGHPWFNEQFPPLLLVVPGQDNLVDPYRLIRRIKQTEARVMRKVKITEIPEYSHLDVLWASDVVEKIGAPLVSFISEAREGN